MDAEGASIGLVAHDAGPLIPPELQAEAAREQQAQQGQTPVNVLSMVRRYSMQRVPRRCVSLLDAEGLRPVCCLHRQRSL